MTLIVGLGPGDTGSVPAAALAALEGRAPLYAVDLPEALQQHVGPLPPPPHPLPDEAVVVATDPVAMSLARKYPAADTVPDRDTLRRRAIGAQVADLAAVGWHLRAACPWDREQNAATIVPHTIEEAYEVADAVASADAALLRDELGDLLFQAVFLSQLLEETGDGDLGEVAAGQVTKLISRHPHVYGDERADQAAAVLNVWERRKREERPDQGIFHELPTGAPAMAYATKVNKRAAAVGFTFTTLDAALACLDEEVGELRAHPSPEELGDVLFAAIAVARQLGADPELALRGTAQRWKGRVEAAADAAAAAGESFEQLPAARQQYWYEHARGAQTD